MTEDTSANLLLCLVAGWGPKRAYDMCGTQRGVVHVQLSKHSGLKRCKGVLHASAQQACTGRSLENREGHELGVSQQDKMDVGVRQVSARDRVTGHITSGGGWGRTAAHAGEDGAAERDQDEQHDRVLKRGGVGSMLA